MRRRHLLLLLLPLLLPVTGLPSASDAPERTRAAAPGPRRPTPRSRPRVVQPEEAPDAQTAEPPPEERMVLVLREPSSGLLVVPRGETLDPRALEDRDDPDLASLIAARAGARDRHLAAWQEALTELGPGELVAPRDLVGPPEVGEVLALADAIDDRRGDPRAADLTDLFRAEALIEGGEASEVDRARSLAEELLLEADDDVARQAAALLGRLPRAAPVGAAHLDRLATLVDADPGGQLDAASWALDQALREGDEGRAQAWTVRLEAGLDAACDRTRLDEDPRCATDAANLDEALGWLGLRDPADADDWRQAIEIAAHACAREQPDEVPAELEAEALWDGAWRFGAWAPGATPFTRCLEQELGDAPEPEAPVRVTLRVLAIR